MLVYEGYQITGAENVQNAYSGTHNFGSIKDRASGLRVYGVFGYGRSNGVTAMFVT